MILHIGFAQNETPPYTGIQFSVRLHTDEFGREMQEEELWAVQESIADACSSYLDSDMNQDYFPMVQIVCRSFDPDADVVAVHSYLDPQPDILI